MDITVIGGGAAGMAAAISAARQGAKVCLIEKNNRLGKKLLATGNGRCNYTNSLCQVEDYHCGNQSFLETVLEKMGPKEIISFFEQLGIFPREEGDGRMYPYSGQAAAVLNVLFMELERLKVQMYYEEEVLHLGKNSRDKDKEYELSLKSGKKIASRKVIIATGGLAGPQYGCNGKGYELAKALGHTISQPRPALCQLLSKEPYFKQLKGVRVKGKVALDGRQEHGEIQFTEFGISGICVFDLSYLASSATPKAPMKAILDLFPQIDKDVFYEKMVGRLEACQGKNAEEFFCGLVNQKLAPVILKLSGEKDLKKKCKDISPKELQGICDILKGWKIPITGIKSWEDAQVTAGGVDVLDVEANTMESKKCKGLYFAGEILDVDGKCGGYNLQWAFSSGYIAGQMAAQ